MVIRIACVWIMASGFVCLAQNAGLQGVVTDPSAASVPGVTVTINNVATGIATVAADQRTGTVFGPVSGGRDLSGGRGEDRVQSGNA